jgi:AhpD family alkylhydroperoxidase
MTPRIDYHNASSDGYQAMLGLERFVRNCGLEHRLLELVKTRASQINGCAYCIDMHTKDARAAGETEQRLYGARRRFTRNVNAPHSSGRRR